MDFLTITRAYVPSKTVRRLRYAFKDKKHEYRRKAVSALVDNGLARAKAEIFARTLTAHHIVPLSLGGTNDPSNIVFVREEDHRRIHAFIDAQRGEIVRIPVQKKGEIWDSTYELGL